MTVGSLFSGIGGLDLGLERAGMEVVWQVENDPFCQRVLARHWPEVPRHGDIRELDPAQLEWVDLVCAGFPCQPVSVAGKGLAQADERWLWPEAARLVRHLGPRWVLLENVPGLLARGMGDVLGDLAACGYDAEWDCVPASAVGAPHQRDRVWIVAYPGGAGHGPLARSAYGHAGGDGPDRSVQPERGSGDVPDPERVELRDGRPRQRAVNGGPGARGAERFGADGEEALADAEGQRSQLRPAARQRPWRPPSGRARLADANRPGLEGRGIFGATPERGRRWPAEPDVGRVAHGVPNRVDRLRALGNAVVPQVAEHVGRLILAHDPGVAIRPQSL